MSKFSEELNKVIDEGMKKIETPEFQKEWMEHLKNVYEKEKENPNEFRNWYEKLCIVVEWGQNKTFRIPYSQIIEIPFDWWVWLQKDKYENEDIIKFGKYFVEKIEDRLKQNKMFIKSGLFSNKFDFQNCIIKPDKLCEYELGAKFLNIQYASMCVGCPVSIDLVVREFIESGDRKTIYEGMKLNTEFRVFYDFDKSELIGVANYWDREYVGNNLYVPEDKKTFAETIDEIEKVYNEKLEELKGKVVKVFKGQKEFIGQYSIDFMYVNGEFWLIDMALAKNSSYAEKFGIK